MSGQGQFEFMDDLPRRPKHPERVFLGFFPDETAAHKADQLGRRLSREIGLTGHMLDIDRFHTSILHMGDRKRLYSDDIFAAELAAKAVRIPPFEIIYGQMGSFQGVPKKGRPLKHPLVLLAAKRPVIELYEALSVELRKYGYRVPEDFQPHLTLSYNKQFVPMRAIEPIKFVVKEFALIHSKLWLTEYEILRTWTLH
jgi:2'-5' RNA ligase